VPELEAARFGLEGKPRIFLGYVHPGKVHTTFAMCILRLLMALRHRVTVVPIFSGPNVAQPRNHLVEAFLATDCEHLLMVDTDIEFTPEDVDALLARDLPIVGARYVSKYEDEPEPVAVGSAALPGGGYGRATEEHLGASSGLVKVGGLGMGFTLMKREVLEALGSGLLWPFAEVVVPGKLLGVTGDEADAPHLLSEDICFCFRAAEAGYESWLDLDTRVGHHKSTVQW